MGLFTAEVGGQQAAVAWTARNQEVYRYRGINAPLDIFGGVIPAAAIAQVQADACVAAEAPPQSRQTSV